MSSQTKFPRRAGARLRLALAAGLLLGGGAAHAQGAPAAPAARPPLGQLKIAVIDTAQILKESQAGKRALADLKKVQDQKGSEMERQQKEIRDLQAKIDDGRLSLAQDKLADMEKQLEDKVIALRRMQDDANRELTKKQEEILGSVDQRVMPVINQLGKELGYTLIFRKFESGLIYADDAVDITTTVIKRLDAAQGK
jgi:outer membrane protein